MSVWRPFVAAAAAAVLLMVAGEGHAAFVDSDGDGALDVAEIIAGSDPDDPASSPESAGGTIYLGMPLCTDGADNDLDGFTDAADPGCVDSDGDLADDPVETTYGSDPNDNMSLPEHSYVDVVVASLGFLEVFCVDGLDNDLDGLTDAADPGCTPLDTDADTFDDVTEKTLGSDFTDAGSVPESEGVNPGSCSDDLDNDGDTLTDGADPGCVPATPTAAATALGATATTTTPAATAGTPPATIAALPAAGGGPDGGPTAAPWAAFVLLTSAGLLGGVLLMRRRGV